MKYGSLLLLLCVALAAFGPAADPARAQTAASDTLACANLLANGTMEAATGWSLDDAVTAATYTAGGRDSAQALRLEAAPGAAGSQPRWVTAIQSVALPADTPAELSFWYQLGAEGELAAGQTQAALLDENGELLQVLLSGLTPGATWRQASADLSAFAGQTVQIYFAANARAGGSPVSLLIDDVTLCDPASVAAPAAAPATAPAGAVTPLPVRAPASAPVSDPESLVGFRDLRIAPITLTGPADTATVAFRLPAGWQVQDGAALQLDLQTFALNQDGALLESGPVGAALEIELNGTPLGALPLTQAGDRTASLALPATLFAGQSASAPHQLVFRLNGGVSCLGSDRLRVAINDSSRLLLPHTAEPLAPTLQMLPSPIVQGALERDQATIVVADQPSAGELQAALTAAATLGRMSEGALDLDLTTVGQLADEQRDNANLIFVGTSANLQPIAGLPLTAEGAEASDGIISIAASPWNPARAVLVLTGQEDAGVIKAGQAFSSDTIAASGQGSTAIVSNVSAQPAVRRVDVDRTFALLGYDAQTITGSGTQTLRYRFVVPSGEAVSGDAYFNLVFNTSALINYQRSRAEVSLNGKPIATMTLSPETTQLSTLRITIPPSATRSGQNELAITAQIRPNSDCAVASDDLWLTIWPESLLHMPLNPVESAIGGGPTPGDYPAPFTFDAGLGATAVVLPQDDSAAWRTAARLAFDLGRQAQGSIINLSAHYSDTLDEETRASRNLILVGQPATLPIAAELGDQLGTNAELGQAGAAVSYRTAAANDAGRVAAIVSPWNEQRTLLAVLGASPGGVEQAAAALTNPALRAQLSGSQALVNNGQVIVSAAADNAEAPAGTDPASAGSAAGIDTSPPEFRRPVWIVPTIAISILLIVGILGYVVVTSVMQRRPRP